jgi:hypothetical protein
VEDFPRNVCSQHPMCDSLFESGDLCDQFAEDGFYCATHANVVAAPEVRTQCSGITRKKKKRCKAQGTAPANEAFYRRDHADQEPEPAVEEKSAPRAQVLVPERNQSEKVVAMTATGALLQCSGVRKHKSKRKVPCQHTGYAEPGQTLFYCHHHAPKKAMTPAQPSPVPMRQLPPIPAPEVRFHVQDNNLQTDTPIPTQLDLLPLPHELEGKSMQAESFVSHPTVKSRYGDPTEESQELSILPDVGQEVDVDFGEMANLDPDELDASSEEEEFEEENEAVQHLNEIMNEFEESGEDEDEEVWEVAAMVNPRHENELAARDGLAEWTWEMPVEQRWQSAAAFLRGTAQAIDWSACPCGVSRQRRQETASRSWSIRFPPIPHHRGHCGGSRETPRCNPRCPALCGHRGGGLRGHGAHAYLSARCAFAAQARARR